MVGKFGFIEDIPKAEVGNVIPSCKQYLGSSSRIAEVAQCCLRI